MLTAYENILTSNKLLAAVHNTMTCMRLQILSLN